MPAELIMWTVYDHPSDYPGHFVARKWVGTRATLEHVIGDTLAEIRGRIFEHLPDAPVMVSRLDGDDPKIVEVWL